MSKNIFIVELKRMILSSRFFLTILILIISGAMNVIMSYGPMFELLDSPGTLNLFYASVIDGFSNLMWYIAPIIAIIPYSYSLCDDMNSGYVKSISIRIPCDKYTNVKIITTGLSGGLVFLISYIILFIIFWVVDPSPSVKAFHFVGELRGLYDHSRLLLCIYFIINSFIFGFVYSIFAMGVSTITRNCYLGYTVPVVLYYLAAFIAWVIPDYKITKLILDLLPTNTYEIVGKKYGRFIIIS